MCPGNDTPARKALTVNNTKYRHPLAPVGAGFGRTMSLPIKALLAAVSIVACLIAGSSTSWAADEITAYEVDGIIAADGALHVSASITFSGAVPTPFVHRLSTVADGDDFTYYHFDITNITATAGGSSLPVDVTQDKDDLVITIDTTGAGSAAIVLDYDVAGAAFAGGVTQDGQALTNIVWPYVQGLDLPVRMATGVILAPAFSLGVDCKSGSLAGLQPCQMWAGGTPETPNPFFQDNEIAAGGVVLFSFVMPGQAVAANEMQLEHWTLDRAFSTDVLPLSIALAVLLLGALGLYLMWRSGGRDAASSADPTLIASFVPTGPGTVGFEVNQKVRPGHVGTVVDERVDPIDVTSTLLDLAARGHLRIIELKGEHQFAPPDWTFKRLTSDDELRPFEVTLLDAVAPDGAPAAVVSEIDEAVEKVIGLVQHQLYEDVVERGWFFARPDQTRHRFVIISWTAVAVAVATMVTLVALTGFGLLGLALVGLSFGLMSIGHSMPRRTAAGVDILHGLHALSMALQTEPVSLIPKETAYQEISKILPYAVVLGGTERWVQALTDADATPGVPDPEELNWYHAPKDWHLQYLPGSLDAFVTSMNGRLIGRD